jgi:hypothetical protein
MARLPDWHTRLAAMLAATETRSFHVQSWNCGRFALAAVMATTGRRPVWRSRASLEATADSAGFPRIPPAFARAGDVVLAGDPPRLGVVVDGGRAAFVGPRGLVRVPLTTCIIAWRIA